MHVSKLLVPAVFGLSLVSVTALVVYYVLKKNEEEETDTKVKTARVNIIEVNVPKKIMPALIGRGGSNIKEMENKSGAKINMKAFSDKDYDVCIIRGGNTASQMAEMMVRDFIRQQPEVVEETMEVPGWACGRIIGTGGENINDISHRCGAKIKVESYGENSSHRCVKIRGTLQQIEVAKGLVTVCVAQEKCRREIEESNRSPRHAQQNASTTSMTQLSTGQSESLPGDAKHVKYKRPVESGGSPIEVYVSAVASPSRFWVQFVRPMAQLDALVLEMTEYYGRRENREAHALCHVSVGQVVAAVFRHDGRWYRARVHNILPNEYDPTQKVADLFYLDYGDSEFVALNELCELRADLLGLRFQAMECFLADVQPMFGQEWPTASIHRFEELVDVARWKPLVSRTCTYKKAATAGSDKEKEIPGIKLFEVTEKGELDIGAVLIAEGLATASGMTFATPSVPFGDLGNSRVLGMSATSSARASSLPKDNQSGKTATNDAKANEVLTSSKSHASGLEKSDKFASFPPGVYPNVKWQRVVKPKPIVDTAEKENNDPQNIEEPTSSSADAIEGSPPGVNPNMKSEHRGDPTQGFIAAEKENNESQSNGTVLPRVISDDLKANMNRIDSHHSNLDTVGDNKSFASRLDEDSSQLVDRKNI